MSYKLRITNMEGHSFLLSHIASAKRQELVKKIKDLGGTYVDSYKFEKNVSHVIFGTLKQTEKYIGACITGLHCAVSQPVLVDGQLKRNCSKWIVSPNFILDSHTVGMWLEEVDYQFRIEKKDCSKDQLAITARRWWSKINLFKVVPFQDWQVSILMTIEKASVFKRLLIYGGAKVLQLKKPFSSCAQVTYVFLDDLHAKYVPELQDLGLLCLRENFLMDFILKDPPPDPFDYIFTGVSDSSKSDHLPSDLIGSTERRVRKQVIKPDLIKTPEMSNTSCQSSSVTPSTKIAMKRTDDVQKNCKRARADALENITTNASCQPSSVTPSTKVAAERTVDIQKNCKRARADALENITTNASCQPSSVTPSTKVAAEGTDDVQKKCKRARADAQENITTSASCQLSSVTPLTNVAMKRTDDVQKNCKRARADAQENIANNSVMIKKSKVVLEYLDPNLPAVLKIDQSKAQIHKDKNCIRNSNGTIIKTKSQLKPAHTKSQVSYRKWQIDSGNVSEQMKQKDDFLLHEPIKVEDDTTESSLSVSICQPSIQTCPMTENYDTNPQSQSVLSDIDLLEETKTIDINQTPSNSPISTPSKKSPSAALTLSPNIYLYGLSAFKDTTSSQSPQKTPTKKCDSATVMPPPIIHTDGVPSTRVQKSPSLSKNIYLYGLSPLKYESTISNNHPGIDALKHNSAQPLSVKKSDGKMKDICDPKDSYDKLGLTELLKSEVSHKNVCTKESHVKTATPADKTPCTFLSPQSAEKNLCKTASTEKAIKKEMGGDGERCTKGSRLTPQTKSTKNGMKKFQTSSSREKGKPMQSFLQQFGFRSKSTSSDATQDITDRSKASPQHLNFSQIKTETVSCERNKVLCPLKKRLQFNITAQKEDGYFIVISDSDDEKVSEGQPKGVLENAIVLSSSSDVENDSQVLSRTNKNMQNANTIVCVSASETFTNKTKLERNLFQDIFNASEDENDVATKSQNLAAASRNDLGIAAEKNCNGLKNAKYTTANDETKAYSSNCTNISSAKKQLFDSGVNDDSVVKLDLLPHVSWPLSFSLNWKSGTDEKPFLPSIVSQCMEASRENHFYGTALEHGKATTARKPNVEIIIQLIHLLMCDDVKIKNQAFSGLMSWAENHPPTTPIMAKVYSDLFEISSSHTFLSNLLQGLTEIPPTDGNVLLLEFTVAVLEINFSCCLQDADKKKWKDCLLIKWLWPHSHALHHNSKTKELLRVFEAVISWSHSKRTIHCMSTMISIVAECLRLSSVTWNTQNRRYLSDTVTSFALDVAKIIRAVYPREEPSIVSHIMTFRAAWFRTMITASILSFFDDYFLTQDIHVRDISLKAIVSQYFFLLPSLLSQETTQKCSKITSNPLDSEFSNQCENSINLLKEKNLTAVKVNKRNGKGESALHSAAIRGDAATLKKLLAVPGVDINLKDNNGWTPLHEACNHGRYACVEVLLKFVPAKTLGSFFYRKDGASSKVAINAIGDQGITPLHDAVLNNRVEVCRLLLKYGGESLLKSKTVKGYTALDLATTDEMLRVLNSGWTNTRYSSLNLSQDSQSDDSFSLSQSDSIFSTHSFPSDSLYDEVLSTCTGRLAASRLNCSVFVSLITLLLTSYLESTSVTQLNNGNHVKVSLLTKEEKAILKQIRLYLKVFKKHLRKISTPDTFESLQSQLLMLTAAVYLKEAG